MTRGTGAAAGTPGGGEFTSAEDFESSNLELNSLGFALDPDVLPEIEGKAIITAAPITIPNTEAMMKPETNHPTLRVG
jgi:hypothetical protein